MDKEAWEAICRKCGKCCYEKVDLGGGVIRYLDEPCEHLDLETRLCKVYEKRHEVEPDCISLTEVIVRHIHWLPPECAYVEYVRMQDTLETIRAFPQQRKRRKRSKRRDRNGD